MIRVQLTLTADTELPTVSLEQMLLGAIQVGMDYFSVDTWALVCTGLDDEGVFN